MNRLKATVFAMALTTITMAQEAIDVHSHIITPEFLTSLETEGRQLEEGFPIPKYDATGCSSAHICPGHQTGK